MKIEELFNQLKGFSREELVKQGREAYAQFGEKMSRVGYKHDEIVAFATMLVRLAAGADNFGGKDELELFEAVTNIKTDPYEFKAMTRNADDPEFIRVIDEIVDSLDAASKEAALKFAAVFFAVDNHLGEKEIALFKRLEA